VYFSFGVRLYTLTLSKRHGPLTATRGGSKEEQPQLATDLPPDAGGGSLSPLIYFSVTSYTVIEYGGSVAWVSTVSDATGAKPLGSPMN